MPVNAAGWRIEPPVSVPVAAGHSRAAIADEDPYASPEQVAELECALTDAGVRYQLEVYQGAHHGFAFASLPSFNHDAQQRYWRESTGLFARCLKR